jgi:uncharacterized membrane protein
MTSTAHLWAIGYDGMERAEQVRHTIVKLGETGALTVRDTAVVIRYPDGTVTLDGKPFVDSTKVSNHFSASVLAGLALAAPPLCEQTVRAYLDCVGGACCEVEIERGFVCDVQSMIEPGTSVLFLLDQECDMDAILQGIRGLGGKVLKTNVDPKHASRIQSTLTTNNGGVP